MAARPPAGDLISSAIRQFDYGKPDDRSWDQVTIKGSNVSGCNGLVPAVDVEARRANSGSIQKAPGPCLNQLSEGTGRSVCLPLRILIGLHSVGDHQQPEQNR